jgi:arylsulfatase A-like enzyme
MTGSGRRLPDVLLIVLDTARTFDVSAVWGGGPATTPHLDALAERCLVFPEATSPSCWTLPGHASLFTGLLPSRHGAHELSMRLAPDGPPTLAELLREAGYVTAGVTCNDLISAATGLTRGMQHVVEERDAVPAGLRGTVAERAARRLPALRRRLDAQHALHRMDDDHGGARATRLAGRLLRQLPNDQPLFLFVNYLESHLPYHPPEAMARMYLPDGVDMARARGVNQSSLDHHCGTVQHDERDWTVMRALYRAAVRYVDDLLRQLLDDIRAVRGLDDALIVVTSDHGENIGDHGLMDHQFSLHEQVLRVPLLVRLPGGEQAARRDDMAQLTDVLPTVCEVVGIEAPATQGVSLLHAVDREWTIAEYLAPHMVLSGLRVSRPEVDWTPYDRGLRAVRTRTRKLITASDGRNEMYEIDRDPFELDNRYGSHPDEVRLARLLRTWEQSEKAPALGRQEMEPAVTERLAALGYID